MELTLFREPSSHNYAWLHLGCVDLLREIQLRVQPQLHIFGHIHGADFASAGACPASHLPLKLILVSSPSHLQQQRPTAFPRTAVPSLPTPAHVTCPTSRSNGPLSLMCSRVAVRLPRRHLRKRRSSKNKCAEAFSSIF